MLVGVEYAVVIRGGTREVDVAGEDGTLIFVCLLPTREVLESEGGQELVLERALVESGGFGPFEVV